ncbi:MAG: glutaredoxin family protein [Campylobacterales bacterium]
MAKRVVMFTSPGCSHCITAKQHLKKHKINYKEIDISKNSDAAKDCERHGCRGVPAFMIGSAWICGFDKNKINRALEIKEA